MIALFLAVLVAGGSVGCAQLQRSSGSGYKENIQYAEDRPRSSGYDRQTRQTAYELGKDPGSLTPNDLEEIRTRQKVREMERTLGSKKEREQYSKVLPWLKNDEEKLNFLAIPSLEGRQQ